MSKIVIFNDSPRKNGYTAKVLEQVTKGAKSKSAKVWLDRTFPMLGGLGDFVPRHPGKKFITIFAQGGADPKIGAEDIKFINNVFALYGWTLEDSIHCCGTHDTNFAISEELSLRAFKDGENLIG